MKLLPRKPFLIALIGTVGLFAFYYFGGPVWRPIKARLTGEKTVSQVIEELKPTMAKRFSNLAELTDGSPITILAFKDEQTLEVWKERESGWEFIRSYPFTGFSGKLGPKLQEGDGQIPEGIYQVEYLNPNSSFHLSIKVGYPNEFDREMAVADGREQLGYDIFIHGSNATVGCIPIGDRGIEEVFYLVAKNGYKKTSIIISPCDFRLGKNPPAIKDVNWELKLYNILAKKLNSFQVSESQEK